jgi:hypothetical protein
MRISVALLVVGAVMFTPLAHAADNKDTALKFLNEYVRELSAFNDIRVASEKELKNSSDNGHILDMLNSSEKFQLELNTAIVGLKNFRFSDGRFDQLIPQIISFYRMKIELWRQISDIGSQFVAPKEGVDYGKLLAEMPKLRARLDYIDKTLFESAPLVFYTLVEFTQKDQSKPAHLLITKAERNNLVSTLREDFGSNLDLKDQNYEVTTARLLKTFLLKEKCADEVTRN